MVKSKTEVADFSTEIRATANPEDMEHGIIGFGHHKRHTWLQHSYSSTSTVISVCTSQPPPWTLFTKSAQDFGFAWEVVVDVSCKTSSKSPVSRGRSGSRGKQRPIGVSFLSNAEELLLFLMISVMSGLILQRMRIRLGDGRVEGGLQAGIGD
ncbi:hypothetical protein L202_01148 [Cryptococcus amylolentus CBS 6039]|uniref:Uncharacterized protein n=1 Tax=Cryptococcus amylolentus CBS 6039 TaxID=1295533 RepID=A0A1E3I4X3_9TREE|nr:hypothetical protein L202_01148 [Cryptococcus amylolentus CBS 6039]ODN82891.1 hypothetical protein L202_01148 [Cryptococcus amylolentus CBS 6039]